MHHAKDLQFNARRCLPYRLRQNRIFDGANRDVERRTDFLVFRSDLSDCAGARFRRIRCDDQLIFCLVT